VVQIGPGRRFAAGIRKARQAAVLVVVVGERTGRRAHRVAAAVVVIGIGNRLRRQAGVVGIDLGHVVHVVVAIRATARAVGHGVHATVGIVRVIVIDRGGIGSACEPVLGIAVSIVRLN